MRGESRFDALIEELGLAKSIPLDTAEDDARIATAADEDDHQESDGEGDDATLVAVLRKLSGVVVAQGKAIRTLRAELDALKGRGGQPMEKSMPRPGGARLDGEAFMAKAMAAQGAGRITGTQVAILEAHINVGKQPPADIVQAVLAV